jgi:putative oxidoreductase
MASQATAIGAVSPNVRNAVDIFALAGRVLISLLFLLSGVGKVAAPAATIEHIDAAGLILPSLGFAIAVAVEIGAGAGVLLGYRARLAAIVMAVFTIAAAIGFHRDFADMKQFIHFMKNVAIAGGLLQIAAFGAGRFSLDARARRR